MTGRGHAGKDTSVTKTDFCTPPEFMDLVYRVLGDPVDLDPATNLKSIVRARLNVVLPEDRPEGLTDEDADALGIYFGDGLTFAWAGLTTFVNPPFSRRENGLWADKIHTEGMSPNCAGLIGLVPSSPGAGWFQKTYARAPGRLFWRGRLTYIGAPLDPRTGKPMKADFENFVVYYGPDLAKFLEVFGERGWVP